MIIARALESVSAWRTESDLMNMPPKDPHDDDDENEEDEEDGDEDDDEPAVISEPDHAMSLGQTSTNLILAGELIRLGAAFAIRLGADEDGVASLARGCYAEAQDLVRAAPAGLF